MNATQIAKKLKVKPTQVRAYARKNFEKREGGWEFNNTEVQQLIGAFAPSGKPVVPSAVEPGLTKGETMVLNYMMETGWWNGEENFSDVEANDVAEGIGKPIKSVRGYIGSLVRKDYLYVSDAEDEVPPLIYPGSKLTRNEKTGKYSL